MLRLGKILGIEVSLHWTLFLLVAWTALRAPVGGAMASAAFISAVFACVLAHEFGHALAARQFGIGTNGITLYPIGGVATLERMPREPLQELWVAIAGPLVNVVIAGLLFAYHGPLTLLLGTAAAPWLGYLILANLGLVLFNLLPAFPMDGGRIFRALAAMFLPYARATNLAASVGKVVAIGLAVYGVLQMHLMLILIAGFVYFVGEAEARAVENERRHESRPGYSPGPSPSRSVSQPHGVVMRALRHGQRVLVVWDESRGVYVAVPS